MLAVVLVTPLLVDEIGPSGYSDVAVTILTLNTLMLMETGLTQSVVYININEVDNNTKRRNGAFLYTAFLLSAFAILVMLILFNRNISYFVLVSFLLRFTSLPMRAIAITINQASYIYFLNFVHSIFRTLIFLLILLYFSMSDYIQKFEWIILTSSLAEVIILYHVTKKKIQIQQTIKSAFSCMSNLIFDKELRNVYLNVTASTFLWSFLMVVDKWWCVAVLDEVNSGYYLAITTMCAGIVAFKNPVIHILQGKLNSLSPHDVKLILKRIRFFSFSIYVCFIILGIIFVFVIKMNDFNLHIFGLPVISLLIVISTYGSTFLSVPHYITCFKSGNLSSQTFASLLGIILITIAYVVCYLGDFNIGANEASLILFFAFLVQLVYIDRKVNL